MEMIEKNCWPHIPRQRAMQELWERLRTLLSSSQSPADSTSRPSPPTHPSIDSFST
jgi:hypothetical protein